MIGFKSKRQNFVTIYKSHLNKLCENRERERERESESSGEKMRQIQRQCTSNAHRSVVAKSPIACILDVGTSETVRSHDGGKHIPKFVSF